MSGWATAHLDDIGEQDDAGCHFRPVRLQLGITAFGASVWTAGAAGDPIVNAHDPGDPTADQELFLVVRGHAVFELDGASVDAPTGTFVFAPPGTERRASATEAGTAILLIEGSPGKAYDARGWELWAPLAPAYGAGRYAEVADALREAVEAHPEYGMLFYNLACCESLTGKPTEAVAHLRRAIELGEEFRNDARSDADLDPIRGQAAFRELVSG
jgi:tetratricopeptide (TPR) repeat protein